MFHATTVLAVRHGGQTVMASDGQVTFGDTVVKQSARKIRRLYNDRILAGFAGSAADSFALFSRFEAKLEQYRGNLERSAVELAKDWRTDRLLRRLEAMLIVMDSRIDVPALGHRRSDRARRRDHRDRVGGRLRAGGGEGAGAPHELDAKAIAAQAMEIAAGICIYTNATITIEDALAGMPIYLPETTASTAQAAHAAADRRRARQARHRPGARPSAPSPSRCAIACAGRSCRRSSPRRSRRRTS